MVKSGIGIAAIVVLSTGIATTTVMAQHLKPGAAPAPRAAPAPAPRAAPQMSAPRMAPQMAAPRVAPQMSAPRAAPQMATPRVVPQRFGRPPGGPSPNIVSRPAPPTPRALAAPQQARRPIAGPGQRGGPAIREAVRPGLRDNLARQGPELAGPSARIGRNPNQPNQAFQLAGGNRAIAGRALRNPAFADRPNIGGPAGRALARATFQGSFAARQAGRFADRDGRRHHRLLPALVIGWAGPLFWPYAYDDFVSYTFYPYAYDTFWPNAYDDVYLGMFGPYAPSPGSAYAAVGRSQSSGGARPVGTRTVGADLCSGQTAGLTDWPIERIAQTIQPDDTQRAALDQLRDATAKTLDILKASCPTELPSTPTGRIAAMQARLEAMLQAVRTMRPALETFYQSLSDEQKARFNALGPEDDRDQRQARRDLSQACGERASGIASLPIERIERSVQPDEAQRSALKELEDATAEAVNLLKSECPTYRPLTAVGRIEAMEQRLDAMLRAVQTVRPALERFYSSLSDEQKERFNRLSPAQS
jgi:ABC-type transporter MlaC component